MGRPMRFLDRRWLRTLPAMGMLAILLASGSAAHARVAMAPEPSGPTRMPLTTMASEPAEVVAAPQVLFPAGGTFVRWDLLFYGLALPWLFVGMACWAGCVRARQHRQTLRLLERLEERLRSLEEAQTPSRRLSDPLPARFIAPPVRRPVLSESPKVLW